MAGVDQEGFFQAGEFCQEVVEFLEGDAFARGVLEIDVTRAEIVVVFAIEEPVSGYKHKNGVVKNKGVSPAYCSFLVTFWFGKIHCQRSVFGFVFLGFEVGCRLESEFEFAAEFFAVGKIDLVFLDEELAIHLIGGVFDK
jgi:hypothetical protein